MAGTADPFAPIVGVDIVCPTADVGERSAWSHAVLEVGLARLAGVVPTLCGRPPPPGLAGSLLPSRHLWLDLDLADQDTNLAVHLSLCEADGRCETFTGETETPDAEHAIDEALAGVAAYLGRIHVQGDLDSPSDGYARKMASRAAQVTMGLREASSSPGDRMRDPITRAAFLDPSLTIVQWAVVRAGTADPKRQLAYLRRSAMDRPSALSMAGEAEAHTLLGNTDIAAAQWRAAADAAPPEDPRFLLPAATALVESDQLSLATRYLDKLGGHLDPRIVMLRVRIAEATGTENDALLTKWQEADPLNPEPIRRRISLFLANGDLAAAQKLTPYLHERGEVEEALDLAIATAVNMGDHELARTLAMRSNRPIPNLSSPDLRSTDVQMDAVDALLAETDRTGTRLANLQNDWVKRDYNKTSERCGREMLELREATRNAGSTQRQLLLDTRASATLLQTLLVAPTVRPLLEERRLERSKRLQQRLDAALRSWMAAATYQTQHIEGRSRGCR